MLEVCFKCKRTFFKKVKHCCTWTSETLSKLEFRGGETILLIAEEQNDGKAEAASAREMQGNYPEKARLEVSKLPKKQRKISEV